MGLIQIAKNYCIVVTGLPSSGKTTLGSQIAQALNIKFLDKDSYLENLYEVQGIGDNNWRKKLSRESDLLFQKAAVAQNQVILVSHWKPMGIKSESGTPTEWVIQNFSNIIELHCKCSVKCAALRFKDRNRHRGHLDSKKHLMKLLCGSMNMKNIYRCLSGQKYQ